MIGTYVSTGELFVKTNPSFIQEITGDEPIEREISYDTDRIFSSFFYHDGYPNTIVSDGRFRVILEGQIYDRTISHENLTELAKYAFSDVEKVSDFVTSVDGEYVITCVDTETERVAVINDVLARLPVYWTEIDSGAIFSRSLKAIRMTLSDRDLDVSVDNLSLAQFLLFSYCLGDRTLFNGIKCLPPASLATISPNGTVNIEPLHVHRYDEKRRDDGKLEDYLDTLVDKFETACQNRVRSMPSHKPVIALSGGLDSRLLAAGVNQQSDETVAATMTGSTVSNMEVDTAQQVADVLSIPWKGYEVDRTDTHMNRIWDLKQGQTYVKWAHKLDLYQGLIDQYGRNVTLYTGGGGDKTLPDLRGTYRFKTPTDLTTYIVRRQNTFELRQNTRNYERHGEGTA